MLGVTKPHLVALMMVMIAVGFVVAAEKPLSEVQLNGLAREAMKHTPEKLHFAKGTTFSWVVFTVKGAGLQLALSERIWELLKDRYQTFALEADLPDGSWRPCEEGRCYQDGFIFTVVVSALSSDTVEITYHDFEGPWAASEQTIRYRWNGSRWTAAKIGPMKIS